MTRMYRINIQPLILSWVISGLCALLALKFFAEVGLVIVGILGLIAYAVGTIFFSRIIWKIVRNNRSL